ncbi:MAG: serine hydrolase domain-containing protein [Candidatus Hodarchaeales archaeon]|jgi:CubicO group peptidase (beta-lactamase class C family)
MDDNQSLDELITYYMDVGEIPSLAAAIMKQDRVIWANGYGDQPAVDMIYAIGSVTKAITATAVLQLYERGLIDLDDDVNDYLPFPLRNPNYPNDAISFRMLLSHRSSLKGTHEDYYQYCCWQDLAREMGLSNQTYPSIAEWFREHLFPKGSSNPAVWASESPGTKFAYSNTGFGILGYLIELVSNQSLGHYFSDNIFEPLGMTTTGYNYSDFEEEKLAIPYDLGVTGGELTPLPHYNPWPLGCGGLRTSVLDLSQFLLAHMNNGIFNGTRILKEQTVKLMHEEISGSHYGLGWLWRGLKSQSESAQGHSGIEIGFTAHMYFVQEPYPAKSYGAIVLTNKVASDLLNYLNLILEDLLEEAKAYPIPESSVTSDSATSSSMNASPSTSSGGLLVLVVLVSLGLMAGWVRFWSRKLRGFSPE